MPLAPALLLKYRNKVRCVEDYNPLAILLLAATVHIDDKKKECESVSV